MQQERPFAALEWIGSSKQELLKFPRPVIRNFGYSLDRLQRGIPPNLPVRPMQSLGAGVFELKDSDERAWYRVIYLAVIDDIIYVLHCFEKKSRKTVRRDLELASRRLAMARMQVQERKNAEE